MGIFSKLFKPKYTKWQTYLSTRPNNYYDLTPSPKIKINRSYSQMNAKNYYIQYNESVNLIGTTKKPDVFFQRYDFAITRIIGLIYMKKYVKIEGSNLPETAEKLIDHKQEFVHELILRCSNAVENKLLTLKTVKSKENNINKFETSFQPFYGEMSPENINYVTKLANKLRRLYL